MLEVAKLIMAAAAASAAIAQPAANPDPDAALFGGRESATHMSLSPSGNHVAYIAPGPNGATLAITGDLATGTSKPFLAASKAGEELRWCRFVTDERLVCKLGFVVTSANGLVPFTRLIAIDRDGSRVQPLGQSASWYDAAIRQFDGEIIDWLPGESGSILMARAFIPEAGKIGTRVVRNKEGLGVVRIDTATLKSRDVEAAQRGVSEYLSDGRGAVRLMAYEEELKGMLTGRVRYSYRTAGSRDWRPLTQYQEASKFVPLAVDATSDSLYALKPLNGRRALYRIRLADPLASELVAAHPKVDIDQVIRSANGERVIGYGFAVDKRETVYFDPEYQATQRTLSKVLSKLPLIDFLGASADGSKLLIFAAADNDPGRYFVFDRANKRLNEITLARPSLDGRTLATVRPIEVKLADGTMMPAYLTLPTGKDPKNLPAVVLPHGGPSARDEWGFDWLAQYLAARGYAVLQPNYRGSAGFGDDWMMENGFKSWQVSIGDVADAGRWLAREGIADPNRLAIVGWSYGGYAALQATATQPGLFKAVAAIAPVTDLALLKGEAANYTSGDIVAKFIGSGPHIRDGSPLTRAAEIKVPVLLAHGDLDLNVGVAHSARMNDALRSAGTPVQFLRWKHLDHGLDDGAVRTELLREIGRLLEKSIGR